MSEQRATPPLTFIDARLDWIAQAAKKGLPSPSRDELAAFHDGFAAALAIPSERTASSAAGPKYDESDLADVLEVTYDGSTLILPYEARDVLWDYFEDWDYEGITLAMKKMTRAEIEALPEFEGF